MKITERADALRALYAANPELFAQLIQSLADSVGMEVPGDELGTFNCPQCGTAFSVVSGAATSTIAASKSPAARKKRTLKGSVNPLLVRLARVKGVMVGDIHREFAKRLGPRAKKMTKDQIRQSKIEWMKAELARLERKGKTSAM